MYLRLAAVDFRVEDVPARVGAEQIPALEDGDEVVMANESGGIPAYLRETKVPISVESTMLMTRCVISVKFLQALGRREWICTLATYD